MKKVTYKKSGVDIEAGYEVVRRVKKLARSTSIKGVLGEIGLFGGCFEIDRKKYKEPVLVSGTDGVGTKVKIAFEMNKHDTVGIDLVAMNADDVVCLGAKPLFFLDYIACNKIEPDIIEELLKGMAEGCKQAGCALIGGETAEMSDMYGKDEYDLAGFAVGIVEKKKIINGSKIKAGDVLIGLPSSGLHSNGYTLARKALFDAAKLNVNSRVRGLNMTVGEALLAPTTIYSRTVLKVIDKINIKAIAHITGGGLPENVGRVLPKETKAEIHSSSWKVPNIFDVIKSCGRIADNEMFKAFNMGIGMVLVVDRKNAQAAAKLSKGVVIGEIKPGSGQVEIK
ncbi:MAG: phosphoribosylformylglycinamidine cyclo-ligase [bacterium]